MLALGSGMLVHVHVDRTTVHLEILFNMTRQKLVQKWVKQKACGANVDHFSTALFLNFTCNSVNQQNCTC